MLCPLCLPDITAKETLITRMGMLALAVGALGACTNPTNPTDTPAASALVAQSSVARARITDLGSLPGSDNAEANRVNAPGRVAGVSSRSGTRATLWMAPGRAVDLQPPGTSISQAVDVNDSGAVLVISGGVGGGTYVWTPTKRFRATGNPTAGPFLGVALNNAGQVVGAVTRSSMQQHTYLWSRGTGFRNLGALAGGSFSTPSDINHLGHVVGSSNRDGGGAFSWEKSAHAFLWTRRGGMRDLGTPPGFANSFATAINDRGVIVGYSTRPRGNRAAWRWTPGRGFQMLPSPFPAAADDRALGLNRAGQVVGESFSSGHYHAVLWSPTGAVRELPGFSAGNDANAYAINDRGQAVGRVLGTRGFRAVLWTLAPQ